MSNPLKLGSLFGLLSVEQVLNIYLYRFFLTLYYINGPILASFVIEVHFKVVLR